MKTIFLCGFMGCGKSTVGKRLAEMLGCHFTDMDSYIEQCEGMSIPDIFSQKGEPYFREKETEAVAALSLSGGVVACGGGAMLREQNSAAALKSGCVVFIDVPFEDCYLRIAGDQNRPIVKNNTKESLHEIYKSREPLYRAHSSVVVTGAGSPDNIAKAIIASI